MKRLSRLFLALLLLVVFCLAGPATVLAEEGSTTRVFYTTKNNGDGGHIQVLYNNDNQDERNVVLNYYDLEDTTATYTMVCSPDGSISSLSSSISLPGYDTPMTLESIPDEGKSYWQLEPGQDIFNISQGVSTNFQNVPGIPNDLPIDWEQSEMNISTYITYVADVSGTSMSGYACSGELKIKGSEETIRVYISIHSYANAIKDITDGYYDDVPPLAAGAYTGTGSATMQTPFGQFAAKPGSATLQMYDESLSFQLGFRMKTIAYEGYLSITNWNRRTGEATYEGRGNWEWNGESYSAPWAATVLPNGTLTLRIAYQEGSNLGLVDEMILELALAAK